MRVSYADLARKTDEIQPSSKNGRTVRAETIVLWLCLAVVAIAGLAPIAVMVFESVWHNGQFSLNHYRELISAARFWLLFGNSLRLALATTTVLRVNRCARRNLVREVRPSTAFRVHVAAHSAICVASVLHRARLESLRCAIWIDIRLALRVRRLRSCAFIGIPFDRHTPDIASASNVNGRLEEAGRLASGWPAVFDELRCHLARRAFGFPGPRIFSSPSAS